MQEKTKCYWEQKNQQQFIIVPTHTIAHPCFDVIIVKYIHDIPRSDYNRNQLIQALQRYTICLTDSDHDYIIDEIGRREKMEHKKYISVDNNEEYFFTDCVLIKELFIFLLELIFILNC